MYILGALEGHSRAIHNLRGTTWMARDIVQGNAGGGNRVSAGSGGFRRMRSPGPPPPLVARELPPRAAAQPALAAAQALAYRSAAGTADTTHGASRAAPGKGSPPC